jgi:putative peptide zinc metalloprotease protein
MNSRTMFSSLWHRVEGLRLRLKPGVRLERQVARGDIWYVAQDRLSGKVYRFSLPVRALLVRMDGVRTVGEIWADVVKEFGEDAPAQDEIIHAIGQLYTADLLHANAPIDTRELADRSERMRHRQLLQRYQNPMYLRLPLVNPNRFLDATVHLVRPLFSKAGMAAWTAMVLWFALMTAVHWDALVQNASDRLLAPSNLLTLLLLFPVVKLLHELGHAYAAKVRGGEVPEIGIMFLVFMPAPYVDASSSALFARKWDRIVVGAAGMMVELMLAAIAMAIWLATEPGLLRATAFNVMVIAGASTLIFNGNPLLRFDGYFILSDLIEVPNLGTRASRYWGYLAKRYLFDLRSATSPVMGGNEQWWLLAYAPLAYVYRLVVVASIAMFVGAQYFVVGLMLAAWVVAVSIVWPFAKLCRYVLTSPEISRQRGRAVTVSGAIAAAVLGAVCILPIPQGTVAEGIIWSPGEARLVSEIGGVIVRYRRSPGEHVAKGDALVEIDDPYLDAQKKLTQSRLSELQYRLAAAETSAPIEIELVRQRIAFAESDLAEAERKLNARVLRSPSDGVFIAQRGSDILESYAAKGSLLGYVMADTRLVVRVAVPESDIDIVRNSTRAVSVRLVSSMHDVITGALVREIPAGTRQLPSPALAAAAGGPFATDVAAKSPDITVAPFFDIEVELPANVRPRRWGERVYVRFDHGATPLAAQLSRRIRQIFLARFNV